MIDCESNFGHSLAMDSSEGMPFFAAFSDVNTIHTLNLLIHVFPICLLKNKNGKIK